MKEINAKLEMSIRNSAFSALLCSALGFILLEAWTLHLGGKPVAHVIIGSVGAIVASVIYRAISSRPAAAPLQRSAAVRVDFGRLPGIAHIASTALLVLFGYAGAVALSRGSMTGFAVFVTCASAFPWSTLALCRTWILIPAALVSVALILGLSTAEQLPHPLLFPMAVWMLWTGAISAWLMNIFFRQRKSKAPKLVAHQGQDQVADVAQS